MTFNEFYMEMLLELAHRKYMLEQEKDPDDKAGPPISSTGKTAYKQIMKYIEQNLGAAPNGASLITNIAMGVKRVFRKLGISANTPVPSPRDPGSDRFVAKVSGYVIKEIEKVYREKKEDLTTKDLSALLDLTKGLGRSMKRGIVRDF